MASARRAASATAATAPTTGGCYRATFGGGKKDRHGPLGMLTVAAPALDRFIGILHGAQSIEVISAVFANILVKWHCSVYPFPLFGSLPVSSHYSHNKGFLGLS